MIRRNSVRFPCSEGLVAERTEEDAYDAPSCGAGGGTCGS